MYFSSAIDTIYWKFTHLVRGNDKLSSAAFQNMFITALGYQTPIYLHIPLLFEEKNSMHINARDDFRDLLKKEGISIKQLLILQKEDIKSLKQLSKIY